MGIRSPVDILSLRLRPTRLRQFSFAAVCADGHTAFWLRSPQLLLLRSWRRRGCIWESITQATQSAESCSAPRGPRFLRNAGIICEGMKFTITKREVEGVTIFDLAGRMSFPDPHIQPMFAAALQEGCKGVVINLAGVSYMDSYG